jgi:hypothetical protein
MIRGSSGGGGNTGISTSPAGPEVVEQPDNKIIIPQRKKRRVEIFLSIGIANNLNITNTEQEMCQ